MEKKVRIIIKVTILLLVFNVLSSCGSKSKNETTDPPIESQPMEGDRGAEKSDDPALDSLLAQTVNKFKQLKFDDPKTGKTMSYNLFVPDDYDENKQYPLILFMADASTVGKDTKLPLTQGYGGVIWASESDQKKHPSFVLVPQYSEVTVNDEFQTTDEVEMTIRLLNSVVEKYNIDNNRLYTTGQSMGGMMSMYFNIVHPDLFAASLFVACQWDTSKMQGFDKDKFFYIVAAGDMKAPKGMAALDTLLTKEGAKISRAEWSAKLPNEEQETNVQKMLSKGDNINFITFTLGSVLPASGKGMEHMCSFNYAYKLEAVRDWIFKQSK